ncbi:hypothetical protein [Streptomyces sp. NBC_01803]|uniref:hypothetical protein n=1 Tax=Streptomyces sp. NBC_01803 TaxID=2975946 RepID=UPI002DD83817|nr:hypothetical protein [Streptomyces sp. NBC_01803]WSA46556.1 hypothetical protein OIE51_21645 [Streptomyces sp. NBC_01803]
MSHSSANSPSRRGFLAVAAGGAAALPVICSGRATAASPRELPVVTFPEHPAAVFGTGPSAEPLNASVACGLRRGAA